MGQDAPAYSGKASRLPLRDWNGKVELPGERPDAGGGTAPDCKHFAQLYRDSDKKADFLASVEDSWEVMQTFGGKLVALQEQHAEVLRDADARHRHMVAGDQFGAYLAAVAGQLTEATEKGACVKQDGAHAEILLTTSNHSMAAQVQHKQETTNKRTREGEAIVEHYYSASVYDPNVTNNHKRFTVSEAAEFALQDFASFLSEPALSARDYGACEPDQLQLNAVCSQVDLQTPPLAFTGTPQPGGQAVDTPTLARQMTMATHTFMVPAIQALGAQLAGRSDEEKFMVLQALSPQGLSGLKSALQRGHVGAVQAFGQVMLQAELPAVARTLLLSAPGATGTSGLHMALQGGYADAIAAYADILGAADLPAADVAMLLAAKRADGVPGAYLGLMSGHADAVKAFGAAVNAAPLPPADKLGLLLAARTDGVTGLTAALEDYRSDAMPEFGEAVRQLCAGIEDPVEKAQFKTQALDAITSSPYFVQVVGDVWQAGRHDVVAALDAAVRRISTA